MTDEERFQTLLGLLVVGVESKGDWPILRIERDEFADWVGALEFFGRALAAVTVDDRHVRLVIGKTDRDNLTLTLKTTDRDWLEAPLVGAQEAG